jgi:hypothetical protein
MSDTNSPPENGGGSRSDALGAEDGWGGLPAPRVNGDPGRPQRTGFMAWLRRVLGRGSS